MPVRFRRTIKLFPGVKVNVSKGGISVSVGTRGATLNFSKRGVRQTIGLPGSGLSETSYLIKNKPESEKDEGEDKESEGSSHEYEEEGPEIGCFSWGCLLFTVIVVVAGYFVADAFHLIPSDYTLPSNFLSNLLQQLTQWFKNLGL